MMMIKSTIKAEPEFHITDTAESKCQFLYVPDAWKSEIKYTQNNDNQLKGIPIKNCVNAKKSTSYKPAITVHKSPYHCQQCTKTFSNKRDYMGHNSLHHSGVVNNTVRPSRPKVIGNKPCLCDICNKSFCTKYSIGVHMNQVHMKRSNVFQCDMCPKSFWMQHSLRKHQYDVHTGIRNIICDICSKTFIRLSCLKVHMRIHSGERPFECGICLKTFNRSSNLSAHILMHVGVLKHVCQVCSKAFARENHLNLHMAIHLKTRPFKCDICTKSFNRLSHIKVHMICHRDDRPYSCGVCGKRFKDQLQVKDHRMRLHGGKLCECDVCGKLFNVRNLKIHMKIHM